MASHGCSESAVLQTADRRDISCYPIAEWTSWRVPEVAGLVLRHAEPDRPGDAPLRHDCADAVAPRLLLGRPHRHGVHCHCGGKYTLQTPWRIPEGLRTSSPFLALARRKLCPKAQQDFHVPSSSVWNQEPRQLPGLQPIP